MGEIWVPDRLQAERDAAALKKEEELAKRVSEPVERKPLPDPNEDEQFKAANFAAEYAAKLNTLGAQVAFLRHKAVLPLIMQVLQDHFAMAASYVVEQDRNNLFSELTKAMQELYAMKQANLPQAANTPFHKPTVDRFMGALRDLMQHQPVPQVMLSAEPREPETEEPETEEPDAVDQGTSG